MIDWLIGGLIVFAVIVICGVIVLVYSREEDDTVSNKDKDYKDKSIGW